MVQIADGMLLPGDKVGGRYRILRPLARGGMASVLLALDEPRGAEVVLKQLGPTRPELLPDFRSEFALLASVTHPHLAQVLDFGSTHVRGQLLHYYTTDWVDGSTLEDHAQSAGDERWLRALSDALLGLSALHDIGVVHGDFNPRNILVRQDGRGVLIDLGCARPVGYDAGSISGTPGFIAPELMAGGASAVSADLYAVGRTLARLYELSGATPAAPTRQLIQSASSPDPRQRPADARSVLSALGARSPSGVLRAQSLRLVGRDAERAQFARWLAALVAGRPGPRVLTLSGAPGSGKSRLLRELLSLAELQVPVVRGLAGESASVQWLLQSATQTSERYSGGRGALAVARALGHRGEPIVLALEDTERLSLAEAELLTQLARCLDETAPVGLVMTSAGPPLVRESERLHVGALDLEALRAWTQGSLSDATLGHILAQTAGNPARIELSLRRWTGPAPNDARLAAAADGEAQGGLTSALIQKTLERALPAERERLALLAALDGQVDGHDWGLSVNDFAFGFETGLLDRDRTLARLSSLVELSSLRAALSPELQKSAHRKIAAALSATTGNAFNLPQREAEIIRHLALAGARHEASERLVSAEPIWRVEARPFLSRVAELGTALLDVDGQLCLAEMALLVGEARRASSLVAAMLRARPEPRVALEARLLGAAALTRLGRGARAERLLARLKLREHPPEARAKVSEGVARARVARGDYAGAKRAAEEGLALGVPEVSPMLREALGIAALYGGEVSEAEAYFSEVLSLLGVQASPRDRCRLLGYRAIAAFRAGHAARARDDHAEALEVAESHGLEDLICVCSLNLGTALQQLGDLGGAFQRYERGLALSRAVGRESTELVLLYNRLNIQVEISDLARAEIDVAYLERRAKQSQLVHFGPALALVRAELALKTGALARAREAIESAAAGYEELGLDRERVEVELVRAELEIAEGRLDAAAPRVLEAKRRARELEAADLGLRGDLLQGRIEVERGDTAAMARLGAALDVAERSSQQLIAAKLATERWLAGEALGLPESDRHAEHAHRLWDRLAVHLTEAQRDAFWSAPARSKLLRSRRGEAKVAADEPSGPDAQALLRLLSLSRRINSSLSMEHVLKYAVDAAVELSAAERGFLLLRDDARGPVTLRAATEPDAVPSQTVIDRVMGLGEPLMTTDAEADARLMGQRSVHAQRLKAILCVPIGTPSELMGALYVDSRVHHAPLTARARDLLMALADQVAVALSNVRLHASLEQRSRELAQEKQTVERLAQGQDRELRRLREQLESQRRTLEFRYDYAQIVGRGPGMRAVLTELDRIVDADVNVLIQGESGTGKELIARAIHVHGPRKAGPFVAINCAALPESLLESELFGYVRGAFTGADRDKTGLMLAARGGTLFLDELAELPLSTQAKLLRVLQEREVRPLGSERALPLDVRLVCATHRELLSAAANGEFRQDLFYRVAVVTVRLPPLRERVEDLPELARAILGRLAKSADRPAPELGRDALRALSAHPFPGNIRELENILTRAFVISGGARIGASDLEINPRVAPAPRSTSKKAFAVEERQRILDALNATRWNVSVVSRTLSIPRNTLYRKLQRYGLTRD